LARDGAAQASIVRPADPIPAEKRAVQELVDYLGKVTGAAFEVLDEKDLPAGRPAIYVGPTGFARRCGVDVRKLGKEECVIRTVDGSLVIAGGRPRGVLYGVYIFLEDQLGVRWYAPWIERVPSAPNCTVGPLDVRRQPFFSMREHYGAPLAYYHKPHGEAGSWWFTRNRMNGPHVGEGIFYRSKYSHSPVREECGGGWVMAGPSGHSFWYYFSPPDHYDDHPEYYSLRRGARPSDTKARYGVSGNHLCLTNPELLEVYKNKVREQFRRIPNGEYVSVGINDGGNTTICDCAACRIEAGRHGESGLCLKFTNAIADMVAREFPGRHVQMLAYNPTLAPPRGVRARENVIIFLCEMPLANMVWSPDVEQRREYKNLEGWGKAAEQVWIWDKYNNCFYPFGFVRPEWWHIAENMRLLKRLGITGVYAEDEVVNMDPFIAELYEMRMWLHAKLAEDPDRNVEELMTDFLDGCFGPAGKHIFQYLMLQKERRRLWPWRMVNYDYIRRGQALFDRAEAAAASDPDCLRRVRERRINLDITTLVFRSQATRDFLRQGGSPGQYPYPREAIRDRVLATLRDIRHPYWRIEGGWCQGKQRKTPVNEMAETLVRLLGREKEYAPLPEELRGLPPERVIEVPATAFTGPGWLVHDPEAALGVAIDCPYKKLPFQASVFDLNTWSHIAEARLVDRRDIRGRGYQLYRGSRFVMGRYSYLYLTGGWTPQVHMHSLYDPEAPDRLWDYYASVKFAGLDKGDEPTAVYVDRVFLIDAGNVADVLSVGSGATPATLLLLGRWPFDGDGLNIAPLKDGYKMQDAAIKGAQWAPGRFGQALAFSQRSDSVLLPVDEQRRLSDASFTISLWFRTDSAEYGQVLLDQYHQKKHFLHLRVQGPNSLCFITHDPQSGKDIRFYLQRRDPKPTDGRWHHVLVGHDRDKQRLFGCLDGRAYQEAPISGFPATTAAIRVGAGVTGFLRGAVDELRIYGTAVTTLHGGVLDAE